MFALALRSPALAEPIGVEGECYDVKVRAKPLAQVPSAFPAEDGYIVISWPWFVDLKVSKVIEGGPVASRLTALAVLHSAYVRKSRTWLLRRNSLGSFNILRPEYPDKIVKCGPDAGPAAPYLRPEEGKTLEDYRREGEELYLEPDE